MPHKTCRLCTKYLKRGECPRAEYKDNALNQAACSPTDLACEQFQKKKKMPSGEYFDDAGKFVPALLAEELMSEYHFATLIDSKEIYVYLDGYYQPFGEVLIKKECKRCKKTLA